MPVIDRNKIQQFDKPTTTSFAQLDSSSNAHVQPHTIRNRTIIDQVTAMQNELYYACLDIQAYHEEMATHNQRMVDFASYQDLCFLMQQTNLGANMSGYPLASICLPPYPPAVPVSPSHTQEYEDDDGADGTEEFQYDVDDTFSHN